MSGNMIWRGRIDEQPHTLNLPVAGAYLPGTLVTQSATDTLVMMTAAGGNFYVLGELDFLGKEVEEAYTTGDTGIAYEAHPRQVYQCRMAAATYAKGAALTIGANGRLTAAGAGAIVVAYFDDAPGAYTAGQLADVIIANGHTG